MLLVLVLCAAASILAVNVAAVATNPNVRREVGQFTLVGAGYSEDSQQVTSQKCYSATVSSVSGQQAHMELGTAISFSELQSKLGISVSASGGYAMFAADALADYMRSLQDTDYSMSLNYYYYVTSKVDVEIRGDGDAALSDSGRTFYRNGSNPYFGLLCGDSYIDSYQQGALLTMGFNIKFNSSDVKNEFTAKASASYGNIVKAAGSINSIANEHKISGSVTIQAFQKGGDPSQLANLLSKDSSGNYYDLGCSITAMDNCIKAANGLLDYAKTYFTQQVSSKKNEGFTPIGIRFISFRPIEPIGLKRPASLVTKEVEHYRDELSSKLQEAKYYQQKLHTFFSTGYLVELSDTLIEKANSLLTKANMNVDILMHPTTGAVGCFNTPDRCRSIKDKIDSRLHTITVSDLEFLDGIKYQFSLYGGNPNYVGVFFAGSAGVLWSNVIGIDNGVFVRVPGPRIHVTEFIITDTTCSFLFKWIKNGHSVDTSQITGYSYDGGREYICELRAIQIDNTTLDYTSSLISRTLPSISFTLRKRLSPFFFEAFSANNDH